jgi:hypothetical protein
LDHPFSMMLASHNILPTTSVGRLNLPFVHHAVPKRACKNMVYRGPMLSGVLMYKVGRA